MDKDAIEITDTLTDQAVQDMRGKSETLIVDDLKSMIRDVMGEEFAPAVVFVVEQWFAACKEGDASTLEAQKHLQAYNELAVMSLKQMGEWMKTPDDETKPDLADYFKQANAQRIDLMLQFVQSVKDWFEKRSPTPDAKKTRGRTDTSNVPMRLPQQTWPEIRAAGTSIADGRSGRRWDNVSDVNGGVALRHIVAKQNLQVLLCAGSALEWWGLPNTHAALRDELMQIGIDGYFLLQFVISLALQEANHVSLDLDDLIRLIGKSEEARRNSESRACWRRWVWRALLLFSNLSVIGLRQGVYRKDGKVLDVTRRAEDCFISITGKEWDAQLSADGSTPPQIVHYICGPWLEQYRGNKKILFEFADLRRLAQIPSGKASGRWARSIGLCLNQRWRERSAKSHILPMEETGEPTVHFREHFTRRELLMGERLFRADPDPEDILKGEHPGSAQNYWHGAIELLKEGYIGYYEEIGVLPTSRKNWAEAWLNQEIDIRPKQEFIEDITSISKSATAEAKKKQTRKNQG